jgi:hypothetical protein
MLVPQRFLCQVEGAVLVFRPRRPPGSGVFRFKQGIRVQTLLLFLFLVSQISVRALLLDIDTANLCPKWALRIDLGISQEFRVSTIRNTCSFYEILAKFSSNSIFLNAHFGANANSVLWRFRFGAGFGEDLHG